MYTTEQGQSGGELLESDQKASAGGKGERTREVREGGWAWHVPAWLIDKPRAQPAHVSEATPSTPNGE